jgi:NAD-dependent SIR2 family protein deacetylase
VQEFHKQLKFSPFEALRVFLFSQSPNMRSILDLFQKNTFEVRKLSLLLLINPLTVRKNLSKSAAHASQMASLAKYAAQAQPTAFHNLLGALQSVGILGQVYTQNIDDLEIKVGLTTCGNNANCVQLHGSVMGVICTQCSFTEHLYHHFLKLRSGELPCCPQCKIQIEERRIQEKQSLGQGRLLRPAIILYRKLHPRGEEIAETQGLNA